MYIYTPVHLKSFIWGLEPHRYKGGQLCAIWKQKQSCREPSSYRGILLAEVYGKILHSWARQRLLPTLVHRRAPGQIGGLPSQQTTTAIQLIKLHGRQGRHKKLTTAVILSTSRRRFTICWGSSSFRSRRLYHSQSSKPFWTRLNSILPRLPLTCKKHAKIDPKTCLKLCASFCMIYTARRGSNLIQIKIKLLPQPEAQDQAHHWQTWDLTCLWPASCTNLEQDYSNSHFMLVDATFSELLFLQYPGSTTSQFL